MKIFLSGYMASGKTVVAKQLSVMMKSIHIDLDDHIALIEEKSIPEIFNSNGELYFRNLEKKVLKDILEEPSSMVVALGGGTPCYGNNLELIKSFPRTRMIYLKASVQFLTDRLFSEMITRPIVSHLQNKDDLEDFIRKHLFERGYYYNQADIVVNVEGKTPDQIAQEIVQKLK